MSNGAPIRVGCIVEGDGEVSALPALLARLGNELQPPRLLVAGKLIRVHRDRFLIGAGVKTPSPSATRQRSLDRQRDFLRHVDLAAERATPGGFALVLLDSEGDCPAAQGPKLAVAILNACPRCPSAVAFAHQEYECWFLAAAESLRGEAGLDADLAPPRAPEGVNGAKGWLGRHMPQSRAYSETVDQKTLTSRFDMASAFAACRSFRHLCQTVIEACRTLGWTGSAPWEDGRW